MQGPEEFAEGFAIGVRSLLGHTVGKSLIIHDLVSFRYLFKASIVV